MASAPEPESAPPRARALFGEAFWAPLRSRSALWLCLLFGAETVVFAIIRMPLALSFDAYAFADRGSFLTVCYLAAHGSRPALDFGYPYGLLPVALAQAWFHVFGLTPVASEAAMLMCALAGAWGMARFASAMRLGTVGLAMVVVAFPFAILPSYLSLVYALEAAVLCNGLAEQAAGRRASALALATAACLVKPSMGYLYGFVLLLLTLRDVLRGGGTAASGFDCRGALGAIAPAAVTGAILMTLLGTIYGPGAVLATLLPGSGRAIYRAMGYGSVFSGGHGLLYLPNGGIGFYLFTIAGFWIVASVWLLASGIRAAWRLFGPSSIGRAPGRSEDFVFTAAVLHAVFITIFFGGASSWEYYSYVLVMGAAATSIWDAFSAQAVAGLTLLALSGHLAHVENAVIAWRTTSPDSRTAGLWAPAAERDAWQRVLAATSRDTAAVLTFQGCAAVLFAQFERPTGVYLVPGESLPSEIMAAEQRLKQAPMVFAVTGGDYSAALAFFPQLRSLLARRTIVLDEPLDHLTFTVYGEVRARAPR
ncbi:MAG TPA: hypothetical protein VNF49_05055 [Candidatus Binataceae bacterium]|nr:hypothetical protein [Candidatus Binataceae bacterium]